MTAAMPPGDASAAASIASPRVRTSATASAKSSDPVATSAVYSPKLCPSATANDSPFSTSARGSAIEVVSKAGWVTSVRESSSAGPSKHTRARS